MLSVYGDTLYIETYLRLKLNISNQMTKQTCLFELQMGERVS